MDVVTFSSQNEEEAFFTLDLNDFIIEAVISSQLATGEIKENLYYGLYETKRQFMAFVEQRPDFRYAIEPPVLSDDAPLLAKQMVKIGSQFGLGPWTGIFGALTDLALDILRPLGGNIGLRCGDALVFDCRTEKQLPIFPHLQEQSQYYLSLPGRTLGVGLSSQGVVVATGGLLAATAANWVERELAGGVSVEEILASLRPMVGVIGGVIDTEEQTKVWGHVTCRKNNL